MLEVFSASERQKYAACSRLYPQCLNDRINIPKLRRYSQL